MKKVIHTHIQDGKLSRLDDDEPFSPARMQERAERLIAEGRMPSFEDFARSVEELAQKHAPKQRL